MESYFSAHKKYRTIGFFMYWIVCLYVYISVLNVVNTSLVKSIRYINNSQKLNVRNYCTINLTYETTLTGIDLSVCTTCTIPLAIKPFQPNAKSMPLGILILVILFCFHVFIKFSKKWMNLTK